MLLRCASRGRPVLAAVSMLAQEGDPCTPATMTFMGSPIDARRSPTAPNLLAERRSIEWFQEQHDPHRACDLSRRRFGAFIQASCNWRASWA